jgi:hypothetical protein
MVSGPREKSNAGRRRELERAREVVNPRLEPRAKLNEKPKRAQTGLNLEEKHASGERVRLKAGVAKSDGLAAPRIDLFSSPRLPHQDAKGFDSIPVARRTIPVDGDWNAILLGEGRVKFQRRDDKTPIAEIPEAKISDDGWMKLFALPVGQNIRGALESVQGTLNASLGLPSTTGFAAIGHLSNRIEVAGVEVTAQLLFSGETGRLANLTFTHRGPGPAPVIKIESASLYDSESATPLQSFEGGRGVETSAPVNRDIAFGAVITVNGSAPQKIRTPFWHVN